MEKNKLKPCPFCGSYFVLIKTLMTNCVFVNCQDCDGKSPFCQTKKGAIDSWNRRVAK